MAKKKTLQELTIKDNFLFGAVMVNEENCKEFLEMVLEIPIEKVVVSKEKSIVYHPEYKGVRLDVYARDEQHTHYNIEMQAKTKPALGKRTRYYQSQMDMELLLEGKDYAEIPNTYVIFVCDFDPFGAAKYRYSFQNICKEVPNILLPDGRQIIYLSTCGKNPEEVPEKLVKFLAFVKADLKESQSNFADPYVQKLQEFIMDVKKSREMEARFMILEEMLRDERNAGKAEGETEGEIKGVKYTLLETLNTYGGIPFELRERIEEETDLEVLRDWFRAAIRAGSVEAFEEAIQSR